MGLPVLRFEIYYFFAFCELLTGALQLFALFKLMFFILCQPFVDD